MAEWGSLRLSGLWARGRAGPRALECFCRPVRGRTVSLPFRCFYIHLKKKTKCWTRDLANPSTQVKGHDPQEDCPYFRCQLYFEGTSGHFYFWPTGCRFRDSDDPVFLHCLLEWGSPTSLIWSPSLLKCGCLFSTLCLHDLDWKGCSSFCSPLRFSTEKPWGGVILPGSPGREATDISSAALCSIRKILFQKLKADVWFETDALMVIFVNSLPFVPNKKTEYK